MLGSFFAVWIKFIFNKKDKMGKRIRTEFKSLRHVPAVCCHPFSLFSLLSIGLRSRNGNKDRPRADKNKVG
mgnify:FL=1